VNEVKEGEDLTESGIVFQMAGAVHRKAQTRQTPKLVLVEGS